MVVRNWWHWFNTQAHRLLGAGVVLVVGPLVVLNLWNHPSADDFSYATYVVERGFWPNQVWYFLHWAGRYVANFVTSLTPIVASTGTGTVSTLSLTLYRVVSLVMTVLFCWSLWVVLRQINRSYLQIKPRLLSGVYLVLLATILVMLASPAELFYWYPASVAYCLPFIALFWLLTLWIRWIAEPRARPGTLGLIVLLALVAIGSQEMALMVTSITLAGLSALVYRRFKRMGRLKELLWLWVSILVAAVVAATAPGNFGRKAIWVQRGGALPFGERVTHWATDLVGTFVTTSTQTRLLVLLIVALPLLILVGWHLAKRFRPISPLWTFGLLAAYWIGMSLPGLAASADELLGAGRTVNTYTIVLVLSIFGVLVHLAWYVLHRLKHYAQLPHNTQTILRTFWLRPIWLVGCLLALGWVLASPKSHIGLAWRNVLSGSAIHYDRQLLDRYAHIKNSSEQDVLVPALTDVPTTLFFDDITSDPLDWRNTSYARFFGKRTIIRR